MSEDSRALGCLYGLAIGDALGAPVEFVPRREILRRLGPAGVTEFLPWGGFPPGAITDDTQMSVATFRGLLNARTAGQLQAPIPFIYREYLSWLATQADPYHRRAPGHTCLSALRSGVCGTVESKINDSKGSGGVMRTSSIGLVYDPDVAFKIGAQAAAVTHGHPSGYLPAGFIASLVAELVRGVTLSHAVEICIGRLQQWHGHAETLGKIYQALDLVGCGLPDVDCIHAIGGGWVGEEALAIALFCALRYQDDYAKALLAAVNHSGDSDSTGSIAGAIMGTLLGIEAIPRHWVELVEGAAELSSLALVVTQGWPLSTATASSAVGSVPDYDPIVIG